MRNKPRDQWHNFDFSGETRLGQLEVAISLNRDVLARFVAYAQERVDRKTGIRFKFVGQAAQEVVHKREGDYLSYRVFNPNTPYVFPNDSPHTNRFDSRYNRVEFYIPMARVLSPADLEALKTGQPARLRLVVEEGE